MAMRGVSGANTMKENVVERGARKKTAYAGAERASMRETSGVIDE